MTFHVPVSTSDSPFFYTRPNSIYVYTIPYMVRMWQRELINKATVPFLVLWLPMKCQAPNEVDRCKFMMYQQKNMHTGIPDKDGCT